MPCRKVYWLKREQPLNDDAFLLKAFERQNALVAIADHLLLLTAADRLTIRPEHETFKPVIFDKRAEAQEVDAGKSRQRLRIGRLRL